MTVLQVDKEALDEQVKEKREQVEAAKKEQNAYGELLQICFQMCVIQSFIKVNCGICVWHVIVMQMLICSIMAK